MSLLELKAMFIRKEPTFEPSDCVVEKVIRLSGAEYDSFRRNTLADRDFIRDNVDLMYHEADSGKLHCIMVVGEGRRDGVLVDSSGSDYARYAAFIPNAEDLLTVRRYPALAALNQKLTDIVDYIAEQAATMEITDGWRAVNLEDLETQFGIDLMRNGALRNTVLEMISGRPEIADFELDKNELILYSTSEIETPQLTEAQADLSYWLAVTESSRFKWTEDEIVRLNGRGAMYYIGGEYGQFIRINKDGLLTAGTYEGAIPHIGEAMFQVVVEKQYPDFNAAFEAAVNAGGKKFLVDMFSGNMPIAQPSTEKPSVVAQIKEARQAQPASKEQESPAHKKDKGGPEL